MTDNRLLSQLLNELLDSDATPEDVCRSHPELLPEVRARWREACCFRSQLNTLFPAPEPGINSLAFSREDTVLPQIPFYEVRRVLGHGGVGVVYEARHVRLNRTVALKMLLAGPYALPEERERFQREAAAVAGLHHPNIVQVYDSGEFDKRPYFTMELVEGGTLSEKLAGTPMPARDAAALVATLADAIRAAHAAGIIHRDLKPANILLAPNSNVESRNRKQIPSPKETNPKPEQAGREISDFEFRISDFEPKVSDFGLARRMEGEAGLTRTGAVMGTPSYMAPEQARGDKNAVGAAVDVYALGAILYECLTGRPPFRAETASATMQQVMTDDPVPPARLNRGVLSDLETICLKCLHKSPNRRYASAQELAADLHRFLEGKPILARQAGAAERAVKWARRRPASAALAATALALVGLALGGTLWLERQQAQRRAETARHEGRTSQAVEARLEQAAALEKQGRWPEARTALDVAPLMFESPAQASLREGLRQARADLDMVAALEEIRLRLSEGGRASGTAPPMAGQLYAEAFRHYGIDLTTLEPEEAAAQIRASAIRETLLAFLHDWLFRLPVENQGRLQGVLNQADDDSWRHSFRQALQEKDAKKLSDLTHAPGASAQPPGVIAGLAAAMLENSYKYEAQEFLCQAQQRYPGDFWINYFLGCFWWEDYPQEAVGYFRVAVAIRPTSDGAHWMLGRALLRVGDKEGAIAALRQAATLNPNAEVSKELTMALAQRGRLEEARAAWEKLLERDPPDHYSWYGYAELCLFLGREEDYRRARRALLERFGATTNPFDAERTARACLLLPGTDDELRQAVALAKRAVAEREGDKWGHPYFEFVHGLAEYRQGQFDRAIATMRGDASGVLGPVPRLVLAMSLHRSGQATEARKTLAAAILTHDWRAIKVHARDQNSWIYHILRREAESIILPNLPAFLDGKYLPQDNDERLAMLGACQFKDRTRAMARLYAEAFAISPQLADDLGPGHRCNAARAAALAGCGQGEDAPGLGEAEGKEWRARARRWLLAELAARVRGLNADPTVARLGVREALKRWQKEPDLACVREPAELDKLPADERKDYLGLWNDVAAVLSRTEK